MMGDYDQDMSVFVENTGKDGEKSPRLFSFPGRICLICVENIIKAEAGFAARYH